MGSKGIKNKNFRPIAPNGDTPTQLAIRCGDDAGCDVVVSSDHEHVYGVQWLMRPAELAGDSVSMIDVVKHVLEQIPGEPTQKIVLLQPTQPLRTPAHVQRALELLTPEVDSVVSVVELPRTHHPNWQGYVSTEDGLLYTWSQHRWGNVPAQRQVFDERPTCIRDGTAYVFRRHTVRAWGSIYGERVRPLIIPPDETCSLDTEADWREAERRLKERG